MLRILLPSVLLLVLTFSTFAQCEEGRYRNFVFDNFDLTSDILYGNNLDINETAIDLFLDVYQPVGDTEVNRPLVIVAHGGSFVGGGKDGTDVVPICQDLARMGYVVASIQYRLGIAINLAALTQNAKAAVIRGAQDSKAAVRFFRRDVVESGNTYNIDTDKIYMLGVSAGGFNALNVAYLNTDEEIPSDIDLSDPGLAGGAEGLSGNSGYSSAIAGIVNVAGAIAELDMIQADEVPICSFHGTEDVTVPFGSDMLYFLQTFPIDSVHGSAAIKERVESLGIENCLEIQEEQGHVPHIANTAYYDTLLSISSNFLSHLICTDVELDCEFRDLEIVSSINEFNLGEINIWPNPAKSSLNLKSYNEEALSYSIYDLTGQECMSGIYQDRGNPIDINSLKTGIYLIKLAGSQGVQTLRFFKQI